MERFITLASSSTLFTAQLTTTATVERSNANARLLFFIGPLAHTKPPYVPAREMLSSPEPRARAPSTHTTTTTAHHTGHWTTAPLYRFNHTQSPHTLVVRLCVYSLFAHKTSPQQKQKHSRRPKHFKITTAIQCHTCHPYPFATLFSTASQRIKLSGWWCTNPLK